MKKIKGSKLLKWLHWSSYQFYLKYYNDREALKRDLEEARRHHAEHFPDVLVISSREQMLQLKREGKW
jgi:hypothetical protein